MTDEEKKFEQNKECKCCKILTKFLLNTISVFLGVLLALAVFRGLTVPSFCPCNMGMGMGMSRPLPPPPMMKHHKFHGDKMNKHHPRFEYRDDFEPNVDFGKKPTPKK